MKNHVRKTATILGLLAFLSCDRSPSAVEDVSSEGVAIAPRILARSGNAVAPSDSVLIQLSVAGKILDSTFPYSARKGAISHVPVGAAYAVTVTGFNSVKVSSPGTPEAFERVDLWVGKDSGTAVEVTDSASAKENAPIVLVDTATPLRMSLDTMARSLSTSGVVTIPVAGTSSSRVLRYEIDGEPTPSSDLVPSDGRIAVARTCRVVVRTFQLLSGVWVGARPESLSVHVALPKINVDSMFVDSTSGSAFLRWSALDGAQFLLYLAEDSVSDAVLKGARRSVVGQNAAQFSGLSEGRRYSLGIRSSWGPDSLLSDTGALVRTLVTIRYSDTSTALKDLSVDVGRLSADFAGDRSEYTDSVTSGTTRLLVTAKPAVSGATVTVDGVVVDASTGYAVSVPASTDRILAIVVANKGRERTYRLFVVHKPSGANTAPLAEDRTFSLSENVKSGTVVGTLVAADDGSFLRWTVLDGDENGVFSVDSDRVVVRREIDFESDSVFRMHFQVRDESGLLDTAMVVIQVKNVDEAPVIASLEKTIEFQDSLSVDSRLDTIRATDPEQQMLSFSIESSRWSEHFTINNKGVLILIKSFQDETDTAVAADLSIVVSDGKKSDTAIRHIRIISINKPPVAANMISSIVENTPIGMKLFSLSASDEGGVLRWDILGGSNYFAVDSNWIKVIGRLDFEALPSDTQTILVRVIDEGGLKDTAQILITVRDVNEAPFFDNAPDSLLVPHHYPPEAIIKNLLVLDGDRNASLSYSILSGNEDGVFMVGQTGVLSVAKALSGYQGNVYQLMIEVSDGQLKDTATIKMKVQNLPCGPIDATKEFCDERDSTVYRYVGIGTQVWMAENLNYAANPTGNSYCLNDSAGNCDRYGRLYDWAAAMRIASGFNTTTWGGDTVRHQGICPEGWHLPSASEWETMANVVDLSNSTDNGDEGALLKAKNQWLSVGTDDVGFTALPSGDRGFFGGTTYRTGGAYFWSASEQTDPAKSANYAWYRFLSDDHSELGVDHYLFYKNGGMSVRCVR